MSAEDEIKKLIDHPLSKGFIPYLGYAIRWTGFIHDDDGNRHHGVLMATKERDDFRHDDEGFYRTVSAHKEAIPEREFELIALGVDKIMEMIDRSMEAANAV